MKNTSTASILSENDKPPSADFIEVLRSERRDLLNRLRKTQFTTLKPDYLHAQVIPHASYAPWLNNQNFQNIHQKIQHCTLVDIYRCYELFSLARQMADLEGDFIEVGVWRGGTAALLNSAAPHKTIHLFDTFTGVAKADSSIDTLYTGGEHSDTSQGMVQQLFLQMNLKCNLHPGIFPDDTFSNLPEKISLAHIDVDTYASAKDSFTAIWPKLTCCGVIIFDDYGFFGCEGVTQAVHEITATYTNSLFIHNINGHAILIKKNV